MEREPESQVSPQSPDDNPTTPLPMGLRLRSSDGATVPVDGAVLIGRSPEPDELGLGDCRTLRLGVTSTQVSRNHALVVPTDGSVQLFDLHSTNGTHVARGSSTVEVSATDGVRIEVGDVISIGDLDVHLEVFGAQ